MISASVTFETFETPVNRPKSETDLCSSVPNFCEMVRAVILEAPVTLPLTLNNEGRILVEV